MASGLHLDLGRLGAHGTGEDLGVNMNKPDWFAVRGDETVALDWDIGPDSNVWEIGGFEGRWVAQMAEKYDPYIDVFEPQPWLHVRLMHRFKKNNKVVIHPYGLWVMDAELPLHNMETDGATLLGNDARAQVCQFRDISLEVRHDVDVCLMNIEGSEYVLIPFLLGMEMMSRFRYFWCQFHTFVPDSAARSMLIYSGMARTHTVKWDYFPTAVCWERK